MRNVTYTSKEDKLISPVPFLFSSSFGALVFLTFNFLEDNLDTTIHTNHSKICVCGVSSRNVEHAHTGNMGEGNNTNYETLRRSPMHSVQNSGGRKLYDRRIHEAFFLKVPLRSVPTTAMKCTGFLLILTHTVERVTFSWQWRNWRFDLVPDRSGPWRASGFLWGSKRKISGILDHPHYFWKHCSITPLLISVCSFNCHHLATIKQLQLDWKLLPWRGERNSLWWGWGSSLKLSRLVQDWGKADQHFFKRKSPLLLPWYCKMEGEKLAGNIYLFIEFLACLSPSNWGHPIGWMPIQRKSQKSTNAFVTLPVRLVF